ncbi:MAG: hypothetical protein LLF96_03235 [Eubacteriales bacterium]|nr:hypothetical protein [Eubacteriales bacterium]
MDTRTAAKKWNLSVGTVRKYCLKEYIPGLEKTGAGQYVIPEDARQPNLPAKGKNRTAFDNMWDLLKALYMDHYISAELLHISIGRFSDSLSALRDKKLIALRNPGDAPNAPESYYLTFEGAALMKEKEPRKAFGRLLEKLAVAAVEKGVETAVKATLPSR